MALNKKVLHQVIYFILFFLFFPKNWGEMSNQLSSIQEFLESLEKFVNILSGAKNNMEGRVTLDDHSNGELLDGLKSPSDYLSAGRLNTGVSMK